MINIHQINVLLSLWIEIESSILRICPAEVEDDPLAIAEHHAGNLRIIYNGKTFQESSPKAKLDMICYLPEFWNKVQKVVKDINIKSKAFVSKLEAVLKEVREAS